jgi:enoyl-CoA hydratase/carnithine racemase
MPPVHCEQRGPVLVVTVDRPEARNAIDLEVHAALELAMDRIDGAVRALVITGAGETFVSGGDLKVIRERPFEETLELSQRMTALLDRLEALAVPVIAAIDGPALGGGVEIALACDYRIAARGASLSFRQAAMGLTTGWGATARLSRLVPRGTAVRLLMTAETIDAERARAIGLVDEVADRAIDRAIELARAIETVSPRAVAAFKRTIAAAYGDRGSRAIEWREFERLWGGDDHREALAAFFEKRAARWS